MTHTSDSDLVARCLAGDRNSFNVLIDRYHAVLLNMVRRMVRNPEDAKDIVQGVFLKAFERLHLFNTNMKFFSWLYRIAVNETINFIESSRVRSHTGVADNSHWHTPESEYNRSELVRQVEGAMMQLPTVRCAAVPRPPSGPQGRFEIRPHRSDRLKKVSLGLHLFPHQEPPQTLRHFCPSDDETSNNFCDPGLYFE